jgi:hypothetical protein
VSGGSLEAAVIPVELRGNMTRGKARCFVHAHVTVRATDSVSAGITARSTLAAVGGVSIEALLRLLYLTAKADPNRRFHAF